MKMKTVLSALGFVLSAAVMFGCKKGADDGKVLYGNVTDRELQMAFMIPGRIDRIIPEVGTPVKKGDLLATLESARIEEEIAAAKSAVAVAEANVLVAKAQKEKAERGSREEDIASTASAMNAIAAKARSAKLEKDGYVAAQLGFGPQKAQRLAKAQQKHFEKAGVGAMKVLKEFAMEDR